jgi:hypothetical protein
MGLIITVIIFILTLIILIIIKPNFLYDKKKQRFKQFGYGKNKTILTLPILSIFVSVIVFIFSYFVKEDDNNIINETTQQQFQINTPPISYINTIPQQIPVIMPSQLPTSIGGFDIKSLIEAGIKAKLMENINAQNIS